MHDILKNTKHIDILQSFIYVLADMQVNLYFHAYTWQLCHVDYDVL